MKGLRASRMPVLIAATLVAAGAWISVRSASSVQLTQIAVLTVDTSHPGIAFERGGIGLSIETSELNSGRLNASHTSLVRLMRLLGPSVLRIGGSSVDFSWWTGSGESPPPWATSIVTPTDLLALRGLLTATGWRVLLGVDLGHFEPARAAEEVRYARKILGSALVGVEIGNEPNAFSAANNGVVLRPPTYSVGEYLSEVEAYRQTLGTAAPGVSIYGPAVSRTRWLTEMGVAARIFTAITEHYYPIATCQAGPSSSASQQPTAAELLSPVARQQEDETLGALAQAGAVAGRPTRISETGTGTCSGRSSGAPTLASALWALDWGLRAASYGVQGIYFHGHLGVCRSHAQSPICAPDAEAAEASDVAAQPEYYGLLAASRLEGARFVPTRMIAPHPLPNLTTCATVTTAGTVKIAIDNLAATGLAQPVSIRMSEYTATEEPLAGPSVDAISGVTLGSVQITQSGRWRPRPATLSRAGGAFRVVVRPASSLIITLRPRRSRR